MMLRWMIRPGDWWQDVRRQTLRVLYQHRLRVRRVHDHNSNSLATVSSVLAIVVLTMSTGETLKLHMHMYLHRLNLLIQEIKHRVK